MKRVITVLLAISILMSGSVALASWNSEEDILNLLSELKIMVGDTDGNLRLDDKVSRAEFAKIAIASSKSKNTVAAGVKISPFKDVTYQHWSAPYVRAAVSAGIVSGYIDATFKPDNTVTYEEALTMMLKVLGYSDGDFGYSWPYGQIGLAENLEITENMDASVGETLSRRQVANLVYNTLNAKMKDSQQMLISIFDCEVKKDVEIISSSSNNSSLGENEILTTDGTFEYDDNFKDDYIGRRGDLYIKNGDDFVAFIPEKRFGENQDKYVIYSLLPDAVICYRNGSFEQIDINDGTVCYKDNARSTYAAVKNEMSMGDLLYVKRDGEDVDYVRYEKGSMEGPIQVTSSNWADNFDMDSQTAIMRAGVKVTSGDIQTNDIIYYSKELNMVLAYTDKATGIYEKATPTKDSPTSVTISGKEYKIESVSAFDALSSSGSVKYGDTVTVLLGRSGEIAGVAGASSTGGGTSCGFVIETGKKDFTNPDGSVYSSYYAKLVMPDGAVNEYATDSKCDTLKCAVCNVSFKNGRAILSRKRDAADIYGKVSASKNMIGDFAIADDVKILDTVGTYNDDTPLYKRIYLQRLDGMTLQSSRVLYASKNSVGEIDELILKDITGDCYTYGIITSVTSPGSYVIDINGNQSSYMTSFASEAKGPHKFYMSGTGINSMQQLSLYSGSITSLTRTEARIGNQTYKISDSVVVYHKAELGRYMKIPIDDAINGNYRLSAYYDKSQDAGGRIRIIIAE